MSKCDTCAFGESGGAADEVYNRLKGRIAAFAGIPFFCHHSKSGPEYDWRNGKLGIFELTPGERQVCEGWRAECARLYRPGRPLSFSEQKPADRVALLRHQHNLGNQAMAALEEFVGEKDPERKQSAMIRLEDLTRALFAAPGK